jgi:hypothetical protein
MNTTAITHDTVNAINTTASEPKKKVHRGWLSLEAGGVLLLVLLGTAAVLYLLSSLFSKNDNNSELSNAQYIMSQTRGLLKNQGNYNFTNAAKMTGTLIQFGGMPTGMTINGTPQSGTATAVNVWGGDVSVAPEKVNASTNYKGFSLTYKNVPQEACVTLATKMSGTSLVNELSITGTNNVGIVTAEKAGTQCKADTGSVGSNILIFKSNS